MNDESAAPIPRVHTESFPPISELLKRQGKWLTKARSQHFLRRQETCAMIAEACCLTKDDLAIEVGAGLGNLTVELAARAGRVLSVELDEEFREWHEYLTATYPGLEFLYRDFLKVDLPTAVSDRQPVGQVVGVGNLPYQITSEILFAFIDSGLPFKRLVFMVQKEVADRITAGPAARASGALTYKIALRYKARVALVVPPGEFLPPPKVWSSVIALEPLAQPLVTSDAERRRVYTLLDRVFQYRRKTILNGLQQGGLCASRDLAVAALAAAGVDEKRRPESLELEEVVALARALEQR
jgi:16S rRNA (adenine1518-N6/adenine1519-N6)-dimethyltransferase